VGLLQRSPAQQRDEWQDCRHSLHWCAFVFRQKWRPQLLARDLHPSSLLPLLLSLRRVGRRASRTPPSRSAGESQLPPAKQHHSSPSAAHRQRHKGPEMQTGPFRQGRGPLHSLPCVLRKGVGNFPSSFRHSPRMRLRWLFFHLRPLNHAFLQAREATGATKSFPTQRSPWNPAWHNGS